MHPTARASGSETDQSLKLSSPGQSVTKAIIPTSNNFSVEFWFKADNLSGNYGLLSQGSQGSARYFVQLQTNGRVTLYAFSSGVLEVPAGSISEGRWNHIAFTHEGSASKAYLNGVEVGQHTVAPTRNWSDTLYLGARYDGGLDFGGEIDQIKVWDDVLSPTQVETSMHAWGSAIGGTPPGLLVHYDFNESGFIFDNRASDDNALNLDLTSANSNDSQAPVAITDSSSVSGSTIVKFPRSYLTLNGGWTAPAGVSSIQALVVAGGGGGNRGVCSAHYGAGSGGGQVRDISTPVTPGNTYLVSVGQGGAADAGNCNASSRTSGKDGQPSSFANFMSLGGKASAYDSANGGASGNGNAGASATGNAGNGYNSGGGGGAGGVGGVEDLRDGGAGVSSTITGTARTYGAGGPGINGTTPFYGTYAGGSVFSYTGGDPRHLYSLSTTPITHWDPNSGGGGADWTSGAAGTVIVRYATPQTLTLEPNGGAGGTSSLLLPSGSNASITNPNRANYTLLGWAADANDNVVDYPANLVGFSMPASDTTLYAVWGGKADLLLGFDATDTNSYSSGSSITNLGSTGAANNATKHAGIVVQDQAFDFPDDNTSEFIDVDGTLSSNSLRNGFTIDFYAAIPATGSWDRILDFAVGNGSSEPGYSSNLVVSRLETSSEVNLHIASPATGANHYWCRTPSGAADGTMKRFTFRVTASNCEISIEGSGVTATLGYVGENSDSFGFPAAGITWDNLYIGKSNYDGNYLFRGELRSLRIFTKPFTPAQIDAIDSGTYTYKTVSLNADGGNLNSTPSSLITSGALVLPASGPTRDGYSFAGWAETSGGANLNGSISPAANDEVFALWSSGIADSPTNLVLTSGNSSVDLSWTAPSGPEPITDYKIEYQLRGAGSWSTFTDGVSTSTSATVTGLTANSIYNFRVSTLNTGGTSTPSDVRSTMTISGLISFLDAGDSNSYSGSGDAWTDLTGNDNGVTGVNSPSFDATAKHFDLNGSTQYFSFGTSDADKGKLYFDNQKPYTIAVFFSPDALSASREVLFSRWNGNVGGSYMLEVNSSGVNVQREVTPWRSDPWGSVSNGQKSFAVYTYDGTKATLYLDGVKVGEEAFGAIPDRPLVESMLGARRVSNNPDSHFDGKIYAATIFDESLSASQAAALTALLDTAPEAPTISAVSASSGTLSVSFTPGSNDGTVLTTYQYSTDGGATWRDRAVGTTTSPLVVTTTSVDNSALVDGTTYSVKIRAVNTLNGASSNALSGTPLDLALTPSFGTPTGTSGGFTVQVSNYDAAFSWAASSSAGTSSINGTGLVTVTGLTPGQSATVTVTTSRAGFNGGSGQETGSAQSSFTLTLDNEGSTSTQSVNFNANPSDPSGSTTRAGYTLSGWSDDDDNTAEYAADLSDYTMGSANDTIYAVWTANTYTLTYAAGDNGAGADVTATKTHGVNLTLANLATGSGWFTRSGHKLAGWSFNSDGSTTDYTLGATYSLNESKTLYPVWETTAIEATGDAFVRSGSYVNSNYGSNEVLVFKNAGNSTTNSYNRVSYAEFEFDPAFTWSGAALEVYVTSNADGSSNNGYNNTYTSFQVDIYGASNASWDEGTLTFNLANSSTDGWGLNTGTWPWNPDSATYLGTISIPTSGSTVGQKFALATEALDTFLNADADGNVTIYMRRSDVDSQANLSFASSENANYPGPSLVVAGSGYTYTIAYDINGGTGSVPSPGTFTQGGSDYTVLEGANVTPPANKAFVGWNTKADGTGTDVAAGSTYNTARSVTLYAKYATFPKAVFKPNYVGGPADITQNITPNTNTNLRLNSFSRAGYTFGGWDTVAGGTGTSYTDGQQVSITADLPLFAQWTANTYGLTFNYFSGASVRSFQTGGSVALVTVTKEGYTLDGWSTTQSGGNGEVANKINTWPYSPVVTEAVTVYAIWSLNSYTLTLDNEGNTSTQSLNYNANPSDASGSTTRVGYTLSGWSDDDDNSAEYSADLSDYTMGSANDTIYAVWTADTYTITYDANGATGGTKPADQTKTYDVDLTLASNSGSLEKTNKIFAGWNTANDGSGDTFLVGATYTLNEADTLYALWVDPLSAYDPFTAVAGTDLNGVATTNSIGFEGNWTLVKALKQGGTGNLAENVTTTAALSFAFPRNSGLSAPSSNVGAGTGSAWRLKYAARELSQKISFDSPGVYYMSYLLQSSGTAAVGLMDALPTATSDSNDWALFTGSSYSNRAMVDFGNANQATWVNKGPGETETNSALAASVLTSAVASESHFFVVKYTTVASGNDTVSVKVYKAGDVIPTDPSGISWDVTYSKAITGVANYLAVQLEWNSIVDEVRVGYTWDAVTEAKPTYTVTFDGNNETSGNPPASQIKIDGDDLTLTSGFGTLAKTGYTFDGWNTQTGGGGTDFADGATYSADADVTLYAQWTAKTYTVMFEYDGRDGGDSTSSDTFTVGSGTPIVLPTPTKTGYTLDGWYLSDLLTEVGAAGANYEPGSNLTLYAKWNAINYTLTYATTDGTGTAPVDSANYNKGQSATIKANTGLTRTGYDFAGWVVDPTDVNETPKNVGDTIEFGAANITLEPKWNPKTYTITYNANGATGGSLAKATDSYTTLQAGITLPGSGTLVKPGYTHSGWATVSSNGSAHSGVFTTNTDLTLYSVWTPTNYDFTYDLNTGSGTAPSDQTGNVEGSLTISSIGAATKANHWFGGWNTEPDGSGATYAEGVSVRVPVGGLDLYAIWVPDTYRIAYNANGGTGGPVLTNGFDEATFGLSYNIRDKGTLARTGFAFSYWTTNPAGTGSKYDADQNALDELNTFTPNANTTFYAQWTAVNYSISFLNQFGSNSINSTTRTLGQTIALPDPGTRTGYDFAGWNDGSTSYPVGSTYTVPAQSVSFTAEWTAKTSTITFDWQGGQAQGSTLTSRTYTYGPTAMSLPDGSTYERDGYEFSGWSTSIGGSPVSNFKPTADDVLYAVWTDGNYTLSYDGKGAQSGGGLGTVARGGSVTLPTPVRAGFAFQGWFDNATGGNKLGDGGDSYSPGGSKTLYARWVQNSLMGVDEADLETAATLTVGSGGTGGSITKNSAGTPAATVTVPNGALPENTVVSARYFKDLQRQASLIPGDNNYIFSLLVSWLTGSGDTATVPDTDPDKPIEVTLTSDAIKAGQMIYQVIGEQVTELGRAVANGSVTVQLYTDPEIVVAATVPSAPTSPSATAQNEQATISWSAPTSDGGAAVSSYTVTANPGGATCTTATTSCTITGLTNGTAYTFTVTASNAVGASTASSATSPVTPAVQAYAVTYDSNGGSVVSAGSFTTNGTVSEPADPDRSGYAFDGWSTTLNDATTQVTFPYQPTANENLTLYALWTQVQSSSSSGTNPPVVAPDPTPGPTPSPTPGPVAPPSQIGFVPTPPSTPVSETGPVGGVAGSAERVIVTSDAPRENLVAKGSGWEIKVRVENVSGDTSPVQTNLSLQAQMSGTAALSGIGLRPNTVVEVWAFSDKTYIGTVSVGANGAFESELDLPDSLLPGEHTLQIGTLNTAGQLITLSIPITVKGKVTVGTFKGYIAIYTADIFGQRLSAKVAGKWVVQNPISEFKRYSYSRLVRFTGAGYDIIVDVYINRKFYERTTTRTR